METVIIGVFPHAEAKTLEKKLSEQGLNPVLNHDGQTCQRGCAVTIELRLPQSEIESAIPFLKSYHSKDYAGLTIDFEALNATFDPNQENTQCPACSTFFNPSKHSECPDCGLRFA